jgi:DNA polymerase IV (DinB-like DNA polymerase)
LNALKHEYRNVSNIKDLGMQPGITPGMTPRIILHLDMDSFYASVEVREQPKLRGKPVIIGADPKNGNGRGVVSTCSYEARAFGIRSAMPVSQAFVLCPHAVFLPPNFSHYMKSSSDIMSILKALDFPLQQVSIDEAFLDLTRLGTFGAATDLAIKIKKTIFGQLGLTCSIGLAPTKVVAKIASDFKKPDGLTVVDPENLFSFLAPMPVRKIPGIGKKAESDLFEMGIRTIRDLAAIDIQVLIARFGRSAIALKEITAGIDTSEVKERDCVKSVSRETTFAHDTSDMKLIIATIDALVEEVCRNLSDETLNCKTVTVKVRYQGFITKTKARTLPHYTGDPVTIRSCTFSLVRDILDGRKIRLLGIRLSSFDTRDVRQMTLGI